MGQARQDRLYEEACGLIDGLILLHDRPERPLGTADHERLERALSLFQRVVQSDPGHWPALWLMGKVHQRLGAVEAGLECFAAAHQVNPEQADVAREASIAAMDAGQ